MTQPAGVPYVQTPLISSVYLSDLAKCNIMLKLENTQPSGSFKTRGLATVVSRALAKCDDPSKVEFFSSSGGNAGLATAYASKHYHSKCTVIVPKTTKPPMIKRIQKAGAQVIVYGDHWAQADTYLREKVIPSLPADRKAVYCHPFDGQDIWEGHSTLVDELVKELPAKPDAIVLAVGGGGLYNGVVLGLQRNNWHDVPVVTVETEGAASFYQSIKEGRQVVLDEINTVASSLGATFVTSESLRLASVHPTIPVTVTDQEAISACVNFADDHKFIIEPACGAALATAYGDKLSKRIPHLTPDSTVVVIVCGGTSTSVNDLDNYASFQLGNTLISQSY